MTEGQAKTHENTVESVILVEASQKCWQASWALKDELSSEARGGQKVHSRLDTSLQTFCPVGRDAKKRKNMVLFTPGTRIQDSEEQLRGERIPFKGKKIWRGSADKEGSVSCGDGQPLGLGFADNVI